MCCESKPRSVPAGDLVAIIHRIPDEIRAQNGSNWCSWRLLLTKSPQDEILGELRYEEKRDTKTYLGQKFNVTIWTYANDHTQPLNTPHFDNPVFSHFVLLAGAGPTIVRSKSWDDLDCRGHGFFDLTVGSRGAVGREVDIANEQGQILGRGIIGWN